MVYRLLFILFFTQLAYSQETLPKLLDSLAQTSSESEKVSLSMVIATRLADEDWPRTLQYIDIAENTAKKSISEKIMADFHISVGEIYSEKGAWDITLENWIKAYNFYEKKPLKDRYRLENDLAIAYAETKNYDKAFEFFRKLYSYEATGKSPLNSASILNNMGLVLMNKDLDSSMVYFNKSLDLIKDVHSPDLKVMLFTNLGKISILKEDDRAAKHFFNLAIDEASANSMEEDQAWVYGEFSELYLKNEKLDSAIYYSKSAVEIMDSLAPYSLEQLQAMKVLYKSYIKNGDFKKASKYFEKSLEVSDSLNLEDKRVNVQKLLLQEEYRNIDKIRELELIKRRSNNYILFLSLFALLLLMSVLLYRYHNRLKRTELERQLVLANEKQLSTELELKNKELIGKAMIELHRTEVIEDILNDLKQVKIKAENKQIQNAIDLIVNRLKRNSSMNMWKEFEVRFEQVHESFYKNLLKNHPDLTPRDKRLCALLKLNLNSKEISQITGQSPKSVENARTRLRKKLNITNSQTDLSAYLENFG